MKHHTAAASERTEIRPNAMTNMLSKIAMLYRIGCNAVHRKSPVVDQYTDSLGHSSVSDHLFVEEVAMTDLTEYICRDI